MNPVRPVKTAQIAALYDRYAIPVYNRLGIAVRKASGSWLWDQEGKRYLDFFPGWGVNLLGHCHPRIVKAVQKQVANLIHVPNTFYHEPQARLSEALVKRSFESKTFFTNSGAEAVEAAIKLVRAWGRPVRFEILTMERSFHGRTMGALAATGQPKYQNRFEPMLPGFRHLPFNDLQAVEKAVGPQTAAVMVEPIQGEGGVHIAEAAYLKGLRRLCNERKLLLIFDEITTAMGRTGKLFTYESYGVVPDILLLGKAVAGGLPMGVMLASRSISDIWEKAAHATTFGGNPLVTAAGLAALEAIEKEKLLQNACRQGSHLLEKLKKLQQESPSIRAVRGVGLMIGIELNQPGAQLVKEAASHGLLINCTQERILRLYPALNVTFAQCQKALQILEEILR